MARKKPHGDHDLSQAKERQLEVIAMTNKLDMSQVVAEALVSRADELTRTIAPGKVQGALLGTGSSAKNILEILLKLSKDKQQLTLIHKFGNPLRIACPRCTVQT